MSLKRDQPRWPPKYYAGLSKSKATRRRREIKRFGALHWRNPLAYVGFQTDKGVKGRASGYTARWHAKFPHATSLSAKAKATGVPVRFLRESYTRGMAAWRTGHRPGATQQQWGYARVHSLLLCGKTYHSTDADIARRAKAASPTAAAWWRRTGGC